MDEIEKMLPPLVEGPTRSLNDMLAAGVPHAGGLAQLAHAERWGGLWGDERPGAPPCPRPSDRLIDDLYAHR